MGPPGLGCHRCIINSYFHKHTGPYSCTFHINVCLHILVIMNNRYTVQYRSAIALIKSAEALNMSAVALVPIYSLFGLKQVYNYM